MNILFACCLCFRQLTCNIGPLYANYTMTCNSYFGHYRVLPGGRLALLRTEGYLIVENLTTSRVTKQPSAA